MSNFSESHNRVKLIMNYDVSKTATENSVNEQVIVTPSWSIFKFNEWMKTWDTHDWFTLVQLVLMFLGFFSGGMTSIVSLALGTVAGVAEAAVFLVRDKDPYMATVMLILSILGVDDLMRIPVVKKLGIEGTKQLIRKSKDGVKLTADEIADLKKLGEYIVKNAEEIIPRFKIGIKRTILKYLSKKGSKWALNFIYSLDKTKKLIYVAGLWIPFDYWYIYTFKDDIEKMNLRDNNSFFRIVKWVEDKLKGQNPKTEEILNYNVDFSVIENDFPYFDPNKINNSPKPEILKRNNVILK